VPKPPEPKPVFGADLTGLNTFSLPATAARLVRISHPQQLTALPPDQPPMRLLGEGSNTVFVGDYPGCILLNRIRGVEFSQSGDSVLVTAGAGENWHALVRRCLDEQLHGIENLIMIPGSVGAAPVQNIGAYGVELADVFERLRAFDLQEREFVTLSGPDCRFSYRDSLFKSRCPNRFIICSVTLRLSTSFRPNTGYASLANALHKQGIQNPTARQLAAAVMRLRRHRLPDPARLPNAGSFFKNPLVERKQALEILDKHPALPHWPQADGKIKLAAGWMIEQLGWKGRRMGQVGVYKNHALVLVNHGGASGSALVKLVAAIQASVWHGFGIKLEPEPSLPGHQTCE